MTNLHVGGKGTIKFCSSSYHLSVIKLVWGVFTCGATKKLTLGENKYLMEICFLPKINACDHFLDLKEI